MKPSHVLTAVLPFAWLAWRSVGGAVHNAQKLQAEHVASELKRVSSSSFPAKAPKRRWKAYTFSTYADKYVGKPMSNGKPYSHHEPTVASNDYPLGTRLTLQAENGRRTTATVTDRMARKFSGKRIDLSRSLWNELSGGSKPGLVEGWATTAQEGK